MHRHPAAAPLPQVNDIDALSDWRVSPRQVALALDAAFAEMTFCHGWLHADPHCGNVMVRGGVVVFELGCAGLFCWVAAGCCRSLVANASSWCTPPVLFMLACAGFFIFQGCCSRLMVRAAWLRGLQSVLGACAVLMLAIRCLRLRFVAAVSRFLLPVGRQPLAVTSLVHLRPSSAWKGH